MASFRKRHASQAVQRATHMSAQFDVTQPDVGGLYSSEMDIEAVTSVDLGAGSVTAGSIVDGAVTAPAVDAVPPAAPTGLTLSSDVASDSDNHQVLRLIATLVQPTDIDLFASYVEITADNDGNPDPLLQVPNWVNPAVITIGADSVSASLEGVRGLTQYWARARAADFFGNYSAYTAAVAYTTISDAEAPGMPQNVAMVAGFRGFAARWDATTARDLMFTQVRYAVDDGTGLAPNVSLWQYIQVRTTALWVGDLTPGTKYWMQVRAVDYSGNVVTSATSSTPLSYLSNAEAGWNDPHSWVQVTATASTDVFSRLAHGFTTNDPVQFTQLTGGAGITPLTIYYVIASGLTADAFKVSATLGGATIDVTSDLTVGYVARSVASMLSATPTNIGAADIAANTITSNMISTSGLSADVIKAGLLKLNVADASMADGIEIWNAGIRVGYWNETGLFIGTNAVGLATQPPGAVNYVKISDAGLTVYLAGVATSAITPDGINATAVNFGALPGGHNLLLNSSFELADSTTVTIVSKTWDVTADFTGTELAGTTNVTNTNDIHMTAVSY